MLRIENFSMSMVVFKVLTNAPYKYRALVTYGYVEPGCCTMVEFLVHGPLQQEQSLPGDEDNSGSVSDSQNSEGLAVIDGNDTLRKATSEQLQPMVTRAEERILIQLVFAPSSIQTKAQLDAFSLPLFWKERVETGKKVGVTVFF